MLALIRRKRARNRPFPLHMSFTNLATKLIQNSQQSFGSYPNNRPLSSGFLFLKFAWEIEMSLEGGEVSGLNSSGSLIGKTCELPRWSVDTQIVNVYNHKTLVQTKMNYEPITMSFYDQSSGAVEKLIWDATKEQFDPSDGSKASTAKLKALKITIKMKDLSGESDSNDKVYTLTNAYIVDSQHDVLDYSSSEPILWTLTIRYENLDTKEFSGNVPMTSTGIAAVPKQPIKVLQSGKPTEKIVPPSVKTSTDAEEVNKWVQAGGKETGGGAAYGNPNMVNKYNKNRISGAAFPGKQTAAPATPITSESGSGSNINPKWTEAYNTSYNKALAADGGNWKTVGSKKSAEVYAKRDAFAAAPKFQTSARTGVNQDTGTQTTQSAASTQAQREIDYKKNFKWGGGQ